MHLWAFDFNIHSEVFIAGICYSILRKKNLLKVLLKNCVIVSQIQGNIFKADLCHFSA